MLSETGAVGLNNLKFTGYERDGSGLDYAQARMYSSSRARFTKPDPVWRGAVRKRNPQSLNRYSYVGNDPVNFYDPTGLDACKQTKDGSNEGPIVISTCVPGDDRSGPGAGGSPAGILLDGGEGGGGGSDTGETKSLSELIKKILSYLGTKGAASLYEQAQLVETLLIRFFEFSPNCLDNINETLRQQGRPGLGQQPAIYLQLELLPNEILDSKLGQLGLVPVGSEDADKTLRSFSADAAVTLFSSDAAYVFYSNVITNRETHPAARGATLVDELLHLSYRGDHAYIARQLGLFTSDQQVTDPQAYQAIDTYLRGNCPKNK
jgi:RHS repeat-associated protein